MRPRGRTVIITASNRTETGGRRVSHSEQPWKCAICMQGESARPASRSLSTWGGPGGGTLVVRNVPAEVCDTCGERYFDEATTAQLLAWRRIRATSASRSRCPLRRMNPGFLVASSAASPTSATPRPDHRPGRARPGRGGRRRPHPRPSPPPPHRPCMCRRCITPRTMPKTAAATRAPPMSTTSPAGRSPGRRPAPRAQRRPRRATKRDDPGRWSPPSWRRCHAPLSRGAGPRSEGCHCSRASSPRSSAGLRWAMPPPARLNTCIIARPGRHVGATVTAGDAESVCLLGVPRPAGPPHRAPRPRAPLRLPVAWPTARRRSWSSSRAARRCAAYSRAVEADDPLAGRALSAGGLRAAVEGLDGRKYPRPGRSFRERRPAGVGHGQAKRRSRSRARGEGPPVV